MINRQLISFEGIKLTMQKASTNAAMLPNPAMVDKIVCVLVDVITLVVASKTTPK